MSPTAPADIPAARPAPSAADWVALARPRLAVLGLMMVALSYVIAAPGAFDAGTFGVLMAGSLLALCGASALNQVMEREADGRMRRTAGRPLPSARMTPRAATAYGVVLSAAGLAVLGAGINGLTAASAAVGSISYLGLYTPLKPVTSLATVVGAVPGAVPVLMGWAAARGTLEHGAWVLFGILFLWQLPHFLAIAWMYRADYERAGFRMLPVEDPDGGATARQAINYGLALIPVSLLPSMIGLAGPLYFAGALALGAAYLACGVMMARQRTGTSARRLVKASVYYLPLLFTLLAVDRLAS